MTLAPLNTYQRTLIRSELGWIPVARGLPPYGPRTVEWTPEYVASVARAMHNTQHAAATLREFHFPLSIALAVLCGSKVDLLI